MKSCTIIVTSHDPSRKEWCLETLESIHHQTVLPDYAFIVSGHDSYPRTGRETVFYVPQMEGMAAKLNFGIRIAWTETVLPIADDDLLDKTYLEETLLAMDANNADIVYTDYELFGTDCRTVLSGRFTNTPETNVIPITALFKKDVWVASHYKPIDFLDWDFWWSALENGFTACHVPKPLFKYRTHPNQWSRGCNVEESAKEVRLLHAHP